MDFLIDKIIKHKKTIVISFILVAIICGLLALTVSINYNIIDYLPSEAGSTKSLKLMQEEFEEPIPNGLVMVTDLTLQESLAYKEKLKNIPGISSVMWLDDNINIKTPLEMADSSIVEEYYRYKNALFSITVSEGLEAEVANEIYGLIKDTDAVSGDFIDVVTQQSMARSESTRAMVILVPIIAIILILVTTSWFEPILFLGTIGIAVLINLGTNVFLGEISFITLAISPILQLAVSLDYAIFLLQSFNVNRQKTNDIYKAMSMAIKRSLPTILASASTTLFGFMALLFMDFRIGSDLGINLVKGIIFSFITVIVFLPAVTLFSYKWIDRTRHRRVIPSFGNIGKAIFKFRLIIIILVAIILVPSFLAQQNNAFIYGIGSEVSESSRFGLDSIKINEVFGSNNPIVVLLPKGDRAREEMLSKELSKIPHVTSVIDYPTTVSAAIPPEFVSQEVTKKLYSANYARIILNTKTESEGEIAFTMVEKIQSIASQYYGESFHMLGKSVNLYDIKNAVESDTTKVNLIATLAIAAVILLTFRSISLPILLLLTIKTSIWVNLAIPYFTGNALCYIGFLVISTVQLGATIDYAILLTDHYMHSRRIMGKKEAVKQSLGETTGSIFTSGSILASAGFCLGLVSSDRIISELGILLGRGTLISVLMVVLFLPALLFFLDKSIFLTTWKTNFFKGGKSLG